MFEASLYIARTGSTEAAEGFLKAIHQKCTLLADNPGMGRQREEVAPSLRSAPSGKYVIFYQPVQEGVSIMRVLHGSRDLIRAFEDKDREKENE